MAALQAPNHHLHLARSESADFRNASAGRPGRVNAIDVDRHVGGTGADHVADLPDDGVAAHALVIVECDAGEAVVLAPLDVVGREARAAEANLDRPLRVDQALFDTAAEG